MLNPLIKSLEHERGFKRIITLAECLHFLAEKNPFFALSTQDLRPLNNKTRDRIDKVFQYTMDNFKNSIKLPDIASIAAMSVPAFCNYFKRSTKKNYIDFINEIRIGYACNLLIENQANISEACYESGFNTIANFNKQFLKIKGMTPSNYKKQLQRVR